MSDSVQPHRRQPTRLPCPWDPPGKNSGVGCHFLLQCMKVKSKGKSLSRVQLFATPWSAAYQASPSMGLSRQEYWSGVPSPSPHPHPTGCVSLENSNTMSTSGSPPACALAAYTLLTAVCFSTNYYFSTTWHLWASYSLSKGASDLCSH